MTLNEQIAIAKIMEWEWDDELSIMWDCEPMHYAKLLQARMVEDGWEITTVQTKRGFYIEGYNQQLGRVETTSRNMVLEPAALVALFAKVYNLEGK